MYNRSTHKLTLGLRSTHKFTLGLRFTHKLTLGLRSTHKLTWGYDLLQTHPGVTIYSQTHLGLWSIHKLTWGYDLLTNSPGVMIYSQTHPGVMIYSQTHPGVTEHLHSSCVARGSPHLQPRLQHGSGPWVGQSPSHQQDTTIQLLLHILGGWRAEGGEGGKTWGNWTQRVWTFKCLKH